MMRFGTLRREIVSAQAAIERLTGVCTPAVSSGAHVGGAPCCNRLIDSASGRRAPWRSATCSCLRKQPAGLR
jgi:hypothetical protein